MKHANEDPTKVFTDPQQLRGRTRQMVRIGQRWQRKRDKLIFRIFNIHRSDREVHLVPVNLHDHPKGSDITKVGFADLRKRFRLLKPDQIGGQG